MFSLLLGPLPEPFTNGEIQKVKAVPLTLLWLSSPGLQEKGGRRHGWDKDGCLARAETPISMLLPPELRAIKLPVHPSTGTPLNRCRAKAVGRERPGRPSAARHPGDKPRLPLPTVQKRPFFPPRTELQCLDARCLGLAASSLNWKNKAPPPLPGQKGREGSGGWGRDGGA